MVVRWLVVVVTASCASVPPGPGGEPLLEVNRTTGRVSTTSAAPIQFTMEFADRGVRMPQRILLDGLDFVATGSCPAESGIGIAVFPALIAVAPALGGVDATGGNLVVELAGPTIGQVRVDWMASYPCLGSQQQARGTSRFTVFPNGRIVRHDEASPSGTTLVVDSNECGCGGPSHFYFTSFWTLALAQNVRPDGSQLLDGDPAGCAVYPNHTIGVAWPDTSTRLLTGAGYSAFVHDWANDVATLPPDKEEVTSAIMLSKQTGAASCDDVLADLDDFPIMVGGFAVITDDRGIYLDDRTHTGRFEITTPRRLPRGFAISLAIGGFAEVTRSPPLDGNWFAAQPEGDRTILWFRDGLGAGETIAIDPR